tara:strand:+ start:221 stop:448 length:228 start_codon:yes stop_codon:yes gene_type:complete
MEIGNVLLRTINYQHRLQLVSNVGGIAGQAAMLTQTIDLNTVRNNEPESSRSSENSPNQITDSPAQRAEKLLDSV